MGIGYYYYRWCVSKSINSPKLPIIYFLFFPKKFTVFDLFFNNFLNIIYTFQKKKSFTHIEKLHMNYNTFDYVALTYLCVFC